MIVADTGFLLALAHKADALHRIAVDWYDTVTETLIVPTPIVIETAWLIEDRLGPAYETTFLHSLNTGELVREDLTNEDWLRVEQLVARYRDLSLGTADASIVAVAERLELTTIATCNERDFRVVRPRHC